MRLKIGQHWSWVILDIFVPSDTEENEDITASGAEPGSGSDSGSGELLTEQDEEMRRILELQSSIPYKESKTGN